MGRLFWPAVKPWANVVEKICCKVLLLQKPPDDVFSLSLWWKPRYRGSVVSSKMYYMKDVLSCQTISFWLYKEPASPVQHTLPTLSLDIIIFPPRVFIMAVVTPLHLLDIMSGMHACTIKQGIQILLTPGREWLPIHCTTVYLFYLYYSYQISRTLIIYLNL